MNTILAPHAARLVLAALLTLAGAAPPAHAGHGHINAGVIDQNSNNQPDPGEPLTFVNGAGFAAGSGFAVALGHQSGGLYAGLWEGAPPTMTALAATPDFGGPSLGHASLGAWIWLRLVSVAGPTGATFSFWEEDDLVPGASFNVGAAYAGQQWPLSENDGVPGSDPFGHVHGRVFTVNQAGSYTVGFQLIDRSTGGPGGGPWQSPGAVYYMDFNAAAIPEPAHAALALAALALGVPGWRRRRRKR